MSDLPEPPVPADCDLRDFPFMQLDVRRLRDSEIAAVEQAESFRAAVLLWCAAWHQVPASSLPDDDAALCRLAGYGRDTKTWRAARAGGALRGWSKCSDGRLYHKLVSEKALEAWDKKTGFRTRLQKAREAKLSRQRQARGVSTEGSMIEPNIDPATGSIIERETEIIIGPATGHKGEGEGEGEGEKKEDASHPPPIAADRGAPREPGGDSPNPAGNISPAEVRTAFDAFVVAATALGLPVPTALTPTRKSAIRARLRDGGGTPGWMAMLAALAESPHCLGQSKGGWLADVDYVSSPTGFQRVSEGSFRRTSKPADDELTWRQKYAAKLGGDNHDDAHPGQTLDAREFQEAGQ